MDTLLAPVRDAYERLRTAHLQDIAATSRYHAAMRACGIYRSTPLALLPAEYVAPRRRAESAHHDHEQARQALHLARAEVHEATTTAYEQWTGDPEELRGQIVAAKFRALAGLPSPT